MKLNFLDSILNGKLWLVTLFLQVDPMSKFVTKYIFSDLGFLKWLVIAMFVDLLSGIGKSIKQSGWSSVTSKGLRDTVTKCIQYGSFLVITHVLTHYTVEGQTSGKLLWLNRVAMEFVILIEVKSVYENIVAINPKLDFVKEVLDKLAKSWTNRKIT